MARKHRDRTYANQQEAWSNREKRREKHMAMLDDHDRSNGPIQVGTKVLTRREIYLANMAKRPASTPGLFLAS